MNWVKSMLQASCELLGSPSQRLLSQWMPLCIIEAHARSTAAAIANALRMPWCPDAAAVNRIGLEDRIR
eukprot:3354195-Amphidinium_carterae.2